MHSFVKLRLPDSHSVETFIPTEKNIAVDTKGLLMQPFDITNSALYFRASQNNIDSIIPLTNLKTTEIVSTTYAEFIEKVHKVKKDIKKGKFTKVVVSKMKVIPIPSNFDSDSFFTSINKAYASTCNSFFFSGHSIWIGASPELLVSVEQSKLKMMALAGTVKDDENKVFSPKELEEQQIVLHYLKEVIAPYCTENSIHNTPLEIRNAGPVNHLLNHVGATLKEGINLINLVYALHPTPAVCGYPKNNALEFILEEEPYRDLYTGFFGTWSPRKSCNLFVNLRCVQIFSNNLVFYAGCGITKDSIAEDEWLETEYKINTLHNLIKIN